MSRRHPHPDKHPRISEEPAEVHHERQVAEAKAEYDKKEAEEEIPMNLPAYDPKFFWKINWKILPSDLMFILFGIVLSKGYLEQSHILDSLSPKTILGLYMVVVIAVCWYIGFIMARYQSYYPTIINKIARIILSVAGITLLGYMMAIIIPISQDENNPDKSGTTLAMWATFLLVLGPFVGMGGFMTGSQVVKCEAKGKPYEGGSDEMYYACIFSLILACGSLVYMAQNDFVKNSSIGFIWMIVILFGSAAVGALGIGFLIVVKKALQAIGIYNRLAFIFESLFPCLIIASLIFWNEVQGHYMDGIETHAKLGILIITGVIPFRIVLIFNPPLRFINLIIGILSFLFYIYCMR